MAYLVILWQYTGFQDLRCLYVTELMAIISAHHLYLCLGPGILPPNVSFNMGAETDTHFLGRVVCASIHVEESRDCPPSSFSHAAPDIS
jgi:hypothetical protein